MLIINWMGAFDFEIPLILGPYFFLALSDVDDHINEFEIGGFGDCPTCTRNNCSGV